MIDDELFPDSASEPASAEPQAQPSGEPAPASPPTQATPSPGEAQPTHSVPLDVLLRTREEYGERLRTVQSEAQQLRAWKEEQDRLARERAQQRPDLFKDPDGYDAWNERRLNETVAQVDQRWSERFIDMNVSVSERLWRRELGEKWGSLNEWINQQDPRWVAQMRQTDDPYGNAWEVFDRQQKAQAVQSVAERLGGKSLDEYIEEQLAQRMAGGMQQQPGQPRAPDGKFQPKPSQPAQPRPSAPSLATVNGAAMQPQSVPDGDEAFEATFR